MAQNNDSNYNVVTTTKSKRSSKTALIIGTIIILIIAISVPVGVYLVKQQQDIREKAEALTVCPDAEQCPVPGEKSLLRSCYQVANGEAPQDISCATIANVGTTATCGGVVYYCPTLGADWVAGTPTPSPTETPTLTPTPTATGSATPTSTAIPTTTASAVPTSTATPSITPISTATATATATASPVPIPVTGTSWPTIVGAGLGLLVIIGSILLAF